MRLAGTMKQYSMKAMPQLTRMASQSADCLYLRWPYQAKVMKMLEMVRRMAVRMKSDIGNGEARAAGAREPGTPARGELIHGPRGARIAWRRLCRSGRSRQSRWCRCSRNRRCG